MRRRRSNEDRESRKTAEGTRAQAGGPVPTAPSRRVWAAIAVLIAAVGAAYANSLRGPFVFDDGPSIVMNQSIRHLGSLRVLAAPPNAITTTGRPVVNLSLAINYAIGGLDVVGYHAVNLAIHILAALVLFGLVRRTLLLPALSARFGSASTGLGLTVALLWALHPLQTESVTYIVQRAEALVGLFYFLTFYCLVRGAAAARGRGWYAAAVASSALGMASKEVMVSAPLLVVLFDRIFLAGSYREGARRRWRFWLALAATWVILAVVIPQSQDRGGSAGFGLGMTSWAYARTQFGCIVRYLRLVFWPNPLALDYGRLVAKSAAEIVPYAIVVFLLVAATLVALVRRPKWGFLGAWFFAILAPTSSIVPLAGQTEAEHRMYLPLAAVVVLVVFGVFLALARLCPRSRRALWALVPAVAAPLGFATYQRNKDYQSELALWNGAVASSPRNDRAYLSRADVYRTKGQYEAALRDYDTCLGLNPRYVKAYIGRGNVLASQGRHAEALRDYDMASKVQPDLADAYNGRGGALGEMGRMDEAIQEFDRAIAIDPEFAEAYFNRGNAYRAKGRLDLALDDYDKAIKLRADYAEAYGTRGNLLDGMGQTDAAIRDYDRAIALRPDYAEAYSNRCSAYDLKGQVEAALRDCDQAIALRPGFAEAFSNRGNAHQKQGQYPLAIRDYDQAILLKPDLAAAYINRAIARAQTRAFDQAWADVRRYRSLGGTPNPSFIEELTKISGRAE